ncbi:MAG TPA: cation transporter [Thermoanaerobacterales bacterium]|nr:cation transporter [Thermoanaerobacterales bacterium]
MDRLVQKSIEILLRIFIKDTVQPNKVTDADMRRKYAYLEAFVSISGNFILAIVKVIMGLLLNSISLLADAVHTASDVLTSIVVLIGFKFSSVPADEKHPYGHGRMEFIASFIIAAILIWVGIEFGKTSYVRLISNIPVKGSLPVAGIMVLGGIFKEWMAQFSIELGERTESAALIADAWHHRTDGIASIIVAIAIIASKYGYYKADAILGMGVSALIIYTGIIIAVESGSKLIGEAASEETINSIASYALSIPGVQDVHDIHVHDYGGHKMISLHIKVDSNLPFVKAHEISSQVEDTIKNKTHCEAIVHIDPVQITRKP